VNELLEEGTFPADQGAMPRTICQILATKGVCEESVESYVSGQLREPTEDQESNALEYRLGGYHRLAGLPDLLSCLGDPTPWPVLVGFTVYNSFDQIGSDGLMSVPGSGEMIMGGHEALCLGYDIPKQVAIMQNSWSDAWGDQGYFYMPFRVIADAEMVSDLWIIHQGYW
jgi:hypothetical protein